MVVDSFQGYVSNLNVVIRIVNENFLSTPKKKRKKDGKIPIFLPSDFYWRIKDEGKLKVGKQNVLKSYRNINKFG